MSRAPSIHSSLTVRLALGCGVLLCLVACPSADPTTPVLTHRSKQPKATPGASPTPTPSSPPSAAASVSPVPTDTPSPTPSPSPSPTPTPPVTTFAGMPSATPGLKDGPASQALFANPEAIVSDGQGSFYVADSGNHAIRKIAADGTVTTLAGSGQKGSSDGSGNVATFSKPVGLALDKAKHLYVADYDNNRIRVLDLGKPPTDPFYVKTLVGSVDGFLDGDAKTAAFSGPTWLLFDGNQTLYVSDAYNFRVRTITLGASGSVAVATIAGGKANADGTFNGNTDGVGALAQFEAMFGLALTPASSPSALLIVDTNNYNLRRLDLASKKVTTIAGTNKLGYDGDQGPVTAAKFNYPSAVVVGLDGTLYVSDTQNHMIRTIAPDGKTISRFVGHATDAGAKDGDFTSAQLGAPQGMCLVNGTLYVADADKNAIRAIKLPTP